MKSMHRVAELFSYEILLKLKKGVKRLYVSMIKEAKI
jgi:hypothetical protein